MPTNTEFFIVPLKPGADISDSSKEAAASFQECAKYITQADGFQEMYFGQWVEKPEMLQVVVNWDSIAKHKAFMASPAREPFQARMLTLAADRPSLQHFDFGPDTSNLRTVLSAPVTEFITMHIPGYGVDEYRNRAVESEKMLSGAKEGFMGFAAGVAHGKNVEGGKDAVFALGWSSVEAHQAFRKTEAYKANIHVLRDGVERFELHHVALKPFSG